MRGPPRRQFGPLHLRRRPRPQPQQVALDKERTWPFALCEDPAGGTGFNVRGPDGYVVFDQPVAHARAMAERDRLNAAADASRAFAAGPAPELDRPAEAALDP